MYMKSRTYYITLKKVNVGMPSISLKDLLLGLIGTALAVISMSILIKLIWEGWDRFISLLISLGFSQSIEYIIGIILFIVSVWLGLVQLKKIDLKKGG